MPKSQLRPKALLQLRAGTHHVEMFACACPVLSLSKDQDALCKKVGIDAEMKGLFKRY